MLKKKKKRHLYFRKDAASDSMSEFFSVNELLIVLLSYITMKNHNKIHLGSGIQRLFYFLLCLQLKVSVHRDIFNTDLSE